MKCSSKGFFLIEIVILTIIIISFSLVIVKWYSDFSIKKLSILKRGEAIFIASNFLELVRLKGKMPDNFKTPTGFELVYNVNKSYTLKNFGELEVSVKFDNLSDKSEVKVSTGVIIDE